MIANSKNFSLLIIADLKIMIPLFLILCHLPNIKNNEMYSKFKQIQLTNTAYPQCFYKIL